jgi:hypothetical protein
MTTPTTLGGGLGRDDLRRHINRDRSYVWPPGGGEEGTMYYTSVTTVLNGVPKPWLGAWAAKMVAETAVDKIDLLQRLIHDDPLEAIRWLKGAPWSVRDGAARVGTALHEIAELDALGAHDEADALYLLLDSAGQAKARQVRDFFAKVPLTLMEVESVVYNDTHGYAGTLDFLVEFADPTVTALLPFPAGVVVLDLKTGKDVYSETALQLAAYRAAQHRVNFDTGMREEMVPTTGAAVLHVTSTSWSLVPVHTGPEVLSAFLALLEVGKNAIDPSWVGGPTMRGKA